MQFGAAGSDTLTGDNVEGDLLNGGNGADTLDGKGGNDILVYDAADVAPADLIHYIDGGAGADVLRIDDGALSIFFGAGSTTVDLRGADIRNIEVIGITEEVVSDVTKGTTLKLNAADVIAFSGDALGADTLYIVGSKGDKLQISNADSANWVDGNALPGDGVTKTGVFDDGQGQVFDIYTTQAGAKLYVDQDVKVETV